MLQDFQQMQQVKTHLEAKDDQELQSKFPIEISEARKIAFVSDGAMFIGFVLETSNPLIS